MREFKGKQFFLDLGCGYRKKDGHIGMDKSYFKGVDVLADIDKGLPLKDNAAGGVYSNYFMEHTADLIVTFQEIYRVCKNEAIVILTVPYYSSIGAFQDPTHKNFFTEETFRYFSKDNWYGSDYKIDTNFKIVDIRYHYGRLGRIFPFFRKYLRRYIINSVSAMTVTLEVIK